MKAVTLAVALLIVADPGATIPLDGAVIRLGIARRGGGYTVESVPLERYVARVLAGEAAHDSPPAALDALAIAVRTFALANLGRHRADQFDLCDSTHCQVARAATPVTEAAAGRTAGQILAVNGAPASIFYTASCGGRTEVPSAVWPAAVDPPYLPSRPDTACSGDPVWQSELGEEDIVRSLHAAGFRGSRLNDLRIAARDASGRVARLRVDGLQPAEISGPDFRTAIGRTVGWQEVKSTAFEVARTPGGYRVTGHGWGHGVGLCVLGSVRLAAAGETSAAILQRYFPGLQLTATARTTVAAVAAPARPSTTGPPALPPVLVSLPDEDGGEAASLQAAIARVRDELARTLGVPPPRVTVRAHATTRDFEAATGRPWFVSEAIVGGEIHVSPLAALRARGVLESTIRRGLVHVIVDDVLAGRPAWVREGAAIYYADPRDDRPSSGRVSCPADRDLESPVSVGALAGAYARARACFARQIAAGRSWRDVR